MTMSSLVVIGAWVAMGGWAASDGPRCCTR